MYIVLGLNTIKIEGIRRFHRSDEIRREKSCFFVYITPLETSFESSYDPNIISINQLIYIFSQRKHPLMDVSASKHPPPVDVYPANIHDR